MNRKVKNIISISLLTLFVYLQNGEVYANEAISNSNYSYNDFRAEFYQDVKPAQIRPDLPELPAIALINDAENTSFPLNTPALPAKNDFLDTPYQISDYSIATLNETKEWQVGDTINIATYRLNGNIYNNEFVLKVQSEHTNI